MIRCVEAYWDCVDYCIPRLKPVSESCISPDTGRPIGISGSVHMGCNLSIIGECQNHGAFVVSHESIEFDRYVEEPFPVVGWPECKAEDGREFMLFSLYPYN